MRLNEARKKLGEDTSDYFWNGSRLVPKEKVHMQTAKRKKTRKIGISLNVFTSC